jgi:sugar lactone lactonase YvrE
MIPLTILLAVLAVLPTSRAGGETFPTLIPLPNEFAPEGIATGRGTQFFVGSTVTGEIYKGNLRNGAGSVLVAPSPPRFAVGLAVDRRSNYLFVAGGPSGQAYVYKASTGDEVRVLQVTDPGSLVNDVVVTREAAYFTDSFRPYLYRIPLGPRGRLADSVEAEELPLTGDFVDVPGAIVANGIEATPNGEWLLVATCCPVPPGDFEPGLGAVYRVDPLTGYAMEVDLGGGWLPFADGILLDPGDDGGYTLYVVQNFLNQIAVVQLDAELLTGALVGVVTSPDFRIPATVAGFGNRLYAVNARFDVAPPGVPPPPGTEYEVVGLAKP